MYFARISHYIPALPVFPCQIPPTSSFPGNFIFFLEGSRRKVIVACYCYITDTCVQGNSLQTMKSVQLEKPKQGNENVGTIQGELLAG